MDEKTEQLRDIFMDVSEEGTVTESQEASRGSLTDVAEAEVEERLAATIERMRDRYDFETGLDDDGLVTVVRAFYRGADDEAIADEVGTDADAVVEARLDLHLLRAEDDEADFDVAAFRRQVTEDDATAIELAEAFEVGVDVATHYRRVVTAQAEARQASHRFQSEFEDVLTEAGLSTRHTAAVHEDGLEEATEDIDSLDSDADVSM